MSAQVLEGAIRAEDANELGYYEVYIGDTNVAEWVGEVVPYVDIGERKAKAVLMIEDKVYLEAQGRLFSRKSEMGYSSLTPGCGPLVEVWEDPKYADIIEALERHYGCNAALSLEAI
jgi:hypothetical protein